MSFLQKVGQISGKVGEKAVTACSEVADKTKLMAKRNKIKSKINSEQSAITKQYTNIGKKYFEIFASTPSKEFIEMVDAINASNATIEELNKELEALKEDVTCSGCGITMKRDQQFCPACGTRQENYTAEPEDSEAEIVETIGEIVNPSENKK